MNTPRSASEVLEDHYLTVRSQILDLASALDRIERAHDAQDIGNDQRLAQIRDGINLLLTQSDDRAEQVQMLFSDPYDPDWDQD